jgi:hypothetical protein
MLIYFISIQCIPSYFFRLFDSMPFPRLTPHAVVSCSMIFPSWLEDLSKLHLLQRVDGKTKSHIFVGKIVIPVCLASWD